MKKPVYCLLAFACLLFGTDLFAQSKYEVRAAWLTTAYGLDWPSTKADSPQATRQQKEELIAILDKLSEANFNTVLFQVRTRGDVFYRSAIEPFNALLTGIAGGDPGYDPLAFAIDECHKRGMECHAWLVALPLGNLKHVHALGQRALPKSNPSLCIQYGDAWFLNPGNPQTKVYLNNIVREIVSRYDVDGIHFDYLRYPEGAKAFNDEREFREYGRGLSKEQWRRNNLTEIMRYLYKDIKASKPWVKVSSCPVGKYRDTSRYSSRGWNAYHAVMQDPQRWLAEGLQDQLYPMIYFRGDNFYPFVLDWQEQSHGRHIVPGLGIYFLHSSEGDWQLGDIERQLHFIRNHGLAGEAHYRAGFLMDNTQGIYDELTENYYSTPALQPAMPWLDNVAPSEPTECRIVRYVGYTSLTWRASSDNDPYNLPTYVIYASDTYPVDTRNPENIIAQRVQSAYYVYAPLMPWESKRYFAVSAVDRYGNEGLGAQFGE